MLAITVVASVVLPSPLHARSALPRPLRAGRLLLQLPTVSPQQPAASAAAAEAARLPDDFLAPEEFTRRSTAHRNIAQLRIDAPRALSAPPDGSIFSEDICLRGDLGQTLARGRQAYIAAFAAVAQFSSSPFLPVRLGRLDCEFVPGERLLVRWNTSVATRDALSGQDRTPTLLTGESVYEIDEMGQLCSHTLRDLRFGGRRLLSSTIGAWVALVQRQGSASPAAMLGLLSESWSVGAAGEAAEPRDETPLAAAAEPATPAPPRAVEPPPAGDLSWPRYAALHELAATLLAQWVFLLESPQELGIYSDSLQLRASSGELLISGKPQYAQLLGSLLKAHKALSASPLLDHQYSFNMRALPAAAAPARGAAAATGGRGVEPRTVLGYEPITSAGASRDAEDAEDAADAAAAAADAPPRLVVAWRYAQRGKQRGGGDLFTVNAESSFALVREPTATAAGGAAGGGAAGGGAAGGLRIASHTLGGLELNGRPALPEELLRRLQPTTGGPDVLQWMTGSILAVSGLAPVQLPTARASGGAGASSASPPSATYALNLVRLLSAVHAELPHLLTSSVDLTIFAQQVEVHGLLRERLLQGREALGGALTAARRAYEAVASEDAVQTAGSPLTYSVQVTDRQDVLVVWEVAATLQGPLLRGLAARAPVGLPGVRTGLPVTLRGKVRLRPDAQTGLVREVWVQELKVNEQPLLPEQLTRWVELGADGRSAADVASILRAFAPWLPDL